MSATMDARLSPHELQRYARQLPLPGIGVNGQARLRDARVAVVGVGGLGCPAALQLALAGVGHITLIDDETVEVSNLHRQSLFRVTDVGAPKVDAAHRALLAHCPSVSIASMQARLKPESSALLLQGADVTLDCTDNFPSRYALNDAAVLARVPVVFASIFRFEAFITVLAPARGAPCLRCLYPEAPQGGGNCEEAGVLGATTNMAASVQALEAIKLLLGIGAPLLSRVQIIDGLRGQSHQFVLPRRSGCACEAYAQSGT